MSLMVARTFRFFIALLSVSLSTTTGCSLRPNAMLHVYAGLDASGSARKHLGNYVIVTKGVTEQLLPERDWLTLFRVDNETREFMDEPCSGDTEQNFKTLVEEVRTQSKQSRTLPAKFWETVLERVSTDTRPSLILLFSDGDNDDLRPASWKAIRQYATQLAACRHVKAVVFCGATKENWAKIRAAFAPLGPRLHLKSPNQLTEEAVTSLVEKARE